MELTIKEMMQVFAVTNMTIHNWKNGTGTRLVSKLPSHTIKTGERHRVYFKWKEVKVWASRNEIEVVVHPKLLEL